MGAESVPVGALTQNRVATLRGIHQKMVDAALAGDGVGQVAEVAATHAGRPVAVVVPGRAASVIGVPAGSTTSVESLSRVERYELERGRRGAPEPPAWMESIADIALGGEVIGGAYMLKSSGAPAADAAELLHLVALATVTALALEEAREQEAGRLGSGLIQEVRRGALDGAEVLGRAARLGCDLGAGAIVVVCSSERRPHEASELVTRESPGALASVVGDRVIAVLPATGRTGEDAVEAAVALARRLRGYGRTGVSSYYADASRLRGAIEEAELVLEVASSDERVAEQLNGRGGSGVYRLLLRALASHPEEVRTFYEDTVAPLVRYDDQYRTDLVATLDSYLEQDCNMNATARAIYAHRHTVAYRLQRVRELTGLDPMISEERERLSLGLKAYRIVAPTLPR